MLHRSPDRRRLGLSLLLSACLHLLLLVASHLLAPSPSPGHLPFYRPPQAPSTPRLTGREPEAGSPAMERVAGRLPDLSLDRDAISSIVSGPVESLRTPGDTLGGPIEVGGRGLSFERPVPAEDSVRAQDLEPSMPMEERDGYARLWVPDADTTDQQSASARRARQIVLACLNAMGGVDRLEALHSMAAVVWVRATTRYRPREGMERIWVQTVPAYAHPVAVWRFEAGSADPWERRPYTREGPFSSLTTMVPYYEVGAFFRFFQDRWRSSPPWSRTYRERSEGERWNFVHRFLGEGVHLRYAGTEIFDGRSVHSVRVDDQKYGRTFVAHFDASDALLAAVEEELSEREAQWFRAQRGHQRRKSPVWTTRFEKYEEIQGVLWPTRWRRTEDTAREVRPYFATILLNVAFNGEEPSRQPPEVE